MRITPDLVHTEVFQRMGYDFRQHGGDPALTDNKAALQSLVAKIGADQAFVIVPAGTYTFNTSYSVPANVHFYFMPGAKFQANGGRNLEILGEVVRHLRFQQIFELTIDAGVVTGLVSGLDQTILDPTMFGAGHALTHVWTDEDDRLLLQYTFDLAAAGSGKVLLPARKFYVTHDSTTVEGDSVTLTAAHAGLEITCERGFMIKVYGYTHGLTIADDEDINGLTINGCFKVRHDPAVDGAVSNAFGIRCYMGGTAKIYSLKIDELDIDGCPANGISIWNARRAEIRNVYSNNNQSHGMSTADFEGKIVNVRGRGNLMYCLDISGGAGVPSKVEIDTVDAQENGFAFKTACPGKVTINNMVMRSNKNTGISKTHAGMELMISNVESSGNGSASLDWGNGDGTDEIKIVNYNSNDDNTVSASATAQAGTVNGQRNVYVDDVTGFEIHHMIIIDDAGAGGGREEHYIVDIDAVGNILVVKDDLSGDHPGDTVEKLKSNGTVSIDSGTNKAQIKNLSIKGAGRMPFVTQCPNTNAEIHIEGSEQWGSCHVLGAGGGELDVDIRNDVDGEAGITFNSSGNLKLRGNVGTDIGILIPVAAAGAVIGFGVDFTGCSTPLTDDGDPAGIPTQFVDVV